MTTRHRAAALALLALAIALAIAAQFYFLRRQQYRWDGLIFALLAALCFILSWRLATTRPAGARPVRPRSAPIVAWIRERPAVVGLTGLGLVLSLVAAGLARARAWNQDTTGIVAVWLLGIGAVLAAAFWPTFHSSSSAIGDSAPRPGWHPFAALEGRPALLRWRSSLRAVRRDTWLEAGGVALLTALALALRVTALDRVPYTLAGDEAWFGLTARLVMQGELRNPFVTAHLSMPTLFYWPMTWTMRLAGDNMIGLRLPAALVGAATVPLLYLLARDLWGRRTAFLSSGFLAAYEYHIHYSRLATNNAWDPFFAVLAFWLLERGLAHTGEKPRRCYFLLTGLALGFGLYFYTGARLLPVLVAVCLLFFWIQRRSQAGATALAGPVVLLGLAFLVVAAPILGFALAHPNDWNARINQVGILQSGWLQAARQATGRSTAYLLANQFLRAAGAFHVFPDRSDFYGIQRPLLGFLPAVLATLGMAWALAHARERRYFLALLWFWAVIVTGGMLTENPPTSQRLVLASPAVALLVATGLEQPVHLARRLLWVHRRWADLLLGLLLFGLVASGIRFYFGEYIPSGRYGSENGETATMIGHYAQGLDASYRAYFFGPPRLGWGFGSMVFLAPQIVGQDVVDPLRAPPEFVETGRDSTFIFLPERVEEMSWVQQSFPRGLVREFRDSKGRLRFTAYEVQSQALAPGMSP